MKLLTMSSCQCCPGQTSCSTYEVSSSSSSMPSSKRRRLGNIVEPTQMQTSRVTYRPLIVGAYEYYQKEMLNSLVSLRPKTHYEAVTNQVKTKQKLRRCPFGQYSKIFRPCQGL